MADPNDLAKDFPEAATAKDVETDFPDSSMTIRVKKPDKNAVQAVKDYLLQPPPPGQRHGIPGMAPWTGAQGPDLGPAVRTIGEYVLPGSWPGLVGLAANAIPGAGVLPSLIRTGASAAGGAIAEGVRGADPAQGAVEGGGAALVGELLGGAGRAIGNRVSSMMGPESLVDRAGRWIGENVPTLAAGARTGRDVVRNILSGEGQAALRQEFNTGMTQAFRQLPPGTAIHVPALEQVGQRGLGYGFFEPADALVRLQSLGRSMTNVMGEVKRGAQTGTQLTGLEEAERQFMSEIARIAPPGSRVGQMIADTRAAYGRGQAIRRLFSGGREGMTSDQSRGFLEASPFERGQMIEGNQIRQRADIARRFTPEQAAQLEEIVRRGEADPLRISQPGKTPNVSLHMLGGILPVPTIRPPSAPQPIGATIPNRVRDYLRALGITGTLNSISGP